MTKKIKLIDYDGTNFLKSKTDIEDYLQVAFESGDAGLIARALGNAAKARGMLKTSQETGLNRGGLYRSLVENGNPTLNTLTKVMDTLGYRLTFTPKNAPLHQNSTLL